MHVPAPVVNPPAVNGGGGGGGATAAAQFAVGMLRPPQAVGGSSGSGSGNPETPLPTLPPSSGRTNISIVPAPLAEVGVSSATMATPTAAAVMPTPGPTMESLGNGTAAVSPVLPTAAAAFGSPTAVTPTATLAAVVTPVPPAFAQGSHARALLANAGAAALANPFAASSARDGTLPPAHQHQQQQPVVVQRLPPPGHVAAAASDSVANTRMGAQAATRSASGPGLTGTRPAAATMDAAATGHSARIAENTPPAVMPPIPAAAPAALFAGPAATPLTMTGPSPPSAIGGTAGGGLGGVGGTLELSPCGPGGSGGAVVSMAAVLSDPIKALEMVGAGIGPFGRHLCCSGGIWLWGPETVLYKAVAHEVRGSAQQFTRQMIMIMMICLFECQILAVRAGPQTLAFFCSTIRVLTSFMQPHMCAT